MQLTQAQTDIVRTGLLMRVLIRIGFDFEVSDEMEDIFSSTVTFRLVFPEEFM